MIPYLRRRRKTGASRIEWPIQVPSDPVPAGAERSLVVNEIYKEHSPLGKLRLALEFVEITAGEDGLASRNLSENYLEVKQNG